MRLDGKTAVITGAGNGIGAATARRFAQEGAEIVLADINGDAVEMLAETIRQDTGAKVHSAICDVAGEGQVQSLFDMVQERCSHLDVLYNNAGISGPSGGVTETKREDWQQVFRVNVDGSFACSKAAIPLMKRGGAIINQASVAAIVGGGPPGVGPVAAYTSSKAAIQGLTRSLAYQLGGHEIRCNAILPGSIETDMTKPLMGSPTYTEGVMRATPLHRFGQPDEVAAVAAFLASDDSSFVSGAMIVVDGGYTVAQGPVFEKMAL